LIQYILEQVKEMTACSQSSEEGRRRGEQEEKEKFGQ
jgi:hypothetical protein